MNCAGCGDTSGLFQVQANPRWYECVVCGARHVKMRKQKEDIDNIFKQANKPMPSSMHTAECMILCAEKMTQDSAQLSRALAENYDILLELSGVVAVVPVG